MFQINNVIRKIRLPYISKLENVFINKDIETKNFLEISYIVEDEDQYYSLLLRHVLYYFDKEKNKYILDTQKNREIVLHYSMAVDFISFVNQFLENSIVVLQTPVLLLKRNFEDKQETESLYSNMLVLSVGIIDSKKTIQIYDEDNEAYVILEPEHIPYVVDNMKSMMELNKALIDYEEIDLEDEEDK